MAYPTIEVNVPTMQNTVEEIGEMTQTLTDQMDVLQESVVSLSSMWKGSAHNQLVNQFYEDYETVTDLVTFLTEHIEKMKEATDDYNTCETDIYNEIKKIRI